MKRLILSSFLVVLSSAANAQFIGGKLKEDGRKIVGNPVYIVEGMKNGWAKYELSVDIEGKVTGVKMVESNLKSTPATTILRNHVQTFKFEPGTYYPKHHHAVVKITMIKGEVEGLEINLD